MRTEPRSTRTTRRALLSWGGGCLLDLRRLTDSTHHNGRLVREQLGPRADDVLNGPRHRLGPPWTKDHRVALAATVVCGQRGT